MLRGTVHARRIQHPRRALPFWSQVLQVQAFAYSSGKHLAQIEIHSERRHLRQRLNEMREAMLGAPIHRQHVHRLALQHLPHQSGEDGFRTNLDEDTRPVFVHGFDFRREAHRVLHVLLEQFSNLSGVLGIRLRQSIRKHGQLRFLEFSRRQGFVELFGCVSHQRRVEGTGHGNTARIHAGLFEMFHRFEHRRSGTGNDGLERTVVVRDDYVRERGDGLGHFLRNGRDGRHGSGVSRNRFFDRLAASPRHQQEVLFRQHAGGVQRDIFAVTVSPYHVGVNAEPVKQFISRGVHHAQRGLRDIRFGQCAHQPVAILIAKRCARINCAAERKPADRRQYLVGRGEHVAELGHPNGQFSQHTWVLRTLPWKEKRDLAFQRSGTEIDAALRIAQRIRIIK